MKFYKYPVLLSFVLLAFFSCESDEPSKMIFNPQLTYGSVTDGEGNVYKTIVIGKQTWMAENLRCTKYRDGSPIPNTPDSAAWRTATTGAYCSYNNDAANDAKFGKLYNWYAVVDARKLAPEGWHVANDLEWTALQNYVKLLADSLSFKAVGRTDSLVKVSIAKALSSTAYWNGSLTDGAVGCNPSVNNLTGFSALPGGNRYCKGSFNLMGSDGYWWSAAATAAASATTAKYRNLVYSYSLIFSNTDYKQNGYSVRCVKDVP